MEIEEMNLVVVTGNLGNDMEIRDLAGGKRIGKLRLAVNTGKDRTTWVDVALWDRLIDRGRDLRKGQRILVTGRFDLREWTDKSGNIRTSMEINADNFEFASSKERVGVGAGDVQTEEDYPF